jgi:hypothetical protein
MRRNRSIGNWRAIVLAATLPWALGCELLAPLKGLPGADSGADADSPDGSPDGAAPPAVHCDSSLPFGNALPVYGLNRTPGTEQRVYLSPDELIAYVSAGSNFDFADLYVTKRGSKADPFGPLVPLTELNGPDAEAGVSVTGDQLTVFMNSNRSGDGRIWAATRQTPDVPFGSPSEVLIFGGSSAAWDPYVLPTGKALYFMDNGSGTSLNYRADVNGTDVGDPVLVQLPTRAETPVVSPDELTIYFAAFDPLGTTWGDIWMATRTSTDVPFSQPTDLSELNTTGHNFPEWISPDGCRLYFGRSPAQGGVYSYVAERVPN